MKSIEVLTHTVERVSFHQTVLTSFSTDLHRIAADAVLALHFRAKKQLLLR